MLKLFKQYKYMFSQLIWHYIGRSCQRCQLFDQLGIISSAAMQHSDVKDVRRA